MTVNNGYNTYLNSHYEGMSPYQLILLLYQGAIKHIGLAREGVVEKDIKKRGEHLSKVIAIVSELNASLDSNMKDESTEFLRGLYSSIILELPKVSLHNDVKILDTTNAYITRLKEIWETDVMGKKSEASAEAPLPGEATGAPEQPAAPPPPPPQAPAGYGSPKGYGAGAYGGGGYGAPPASGTGKSFSV